MTIHGLEAFHGEVDAEVFAVKFSAFMKGLAESDEEANGSRAHKFVLTDLRKNTATAELIERRIRATEAPLNSGIAFYAYGIEEIRANSPRARHLPKALVESVVALGNGVSKKFEFGELKMPDGSILLLDAFLEERAKHVLADIKNKSTDLGLFQGIAFGSFDGVLKAVDFQQDTKRGTIRLSAGGLPVACNITDVSIDEVRSALDQRARFYGRASYGGSSPLPKMLDVRKIEVIEGGLGLSRWRGAFDIQIDEGGWSDS
ncbi:hypothetical protein HJA86_02030 [Rhizobium bangladeshense]|nr:hypothetical protein [Rhizobium bangladeshense]